MPVVPAAPDGERRQRSTAPHRAVEATLCRWLRIEPSCWTAYGIAAGGTTAALLLTLVLWPLARFAPLVLLLLSVLAATWWMGVGPGIAAGVLAIVAATCLLPREALLHSADALGLLDLAVFAVACGAICAWVGRIRTRTSALESDREELEHLRAERARLLEGERERHAAVEHARARLRSLASASDLLVASLDYQLVLDRLARLTVEHVADWCVVDMVGPESTLERAAAAARDPGHQSLVCRLRAFPPDAYGGHPAVKVMRTGHPEVVAAASGTEGLDLARSEEHRELLTRLGCASYVTVPISARDRTMGALSVVMSQPDRHLDADDLAFVQELAHRAGLGVYNARLYAEAQEEIAERKRVQAQLAEQREQVGALNARLQRAMTETHHRVKNNLQIIAAMIDLQLMKDQATIPASEIERLGTHVRTLAAVHDILTHEASRDGEAHAISADGVLGKLLSMLRDTAGTHALRSELVEARLPARQGTSLALVTNELVSNAIKHGRSCVDVGLRVEDGTAILTVRDDGPGFPDGFDARKAANTGLDLVENLARWDLGGETLYETLPQGGACVSVRFPLRSV